jgi:phosphate starvation-inducible protein PhoH and related proteins
MSRSLRNSSSKIDSKLHIVKEHAEDLRIKATEPLNSAQKYYNKLLYTQPVVIASGSAGTGKTLLALVTAIEMLRSASNPIEKIVIIRNFQDSFGESVGALPGSLEEKLSVLHGPIIDSLSVFLTEGYSKYLLKTAKIELVPLSFLRGRSLNNSFIIADELSSVSRDAMRLIISRLGKNSKLVLCGDPAQACGSREDGFEWATNNLIDHSSVGTVFFEKTDIVRNSVLSELMSLLEN